MVPIGESADGEHWVNINNKCSNCGHAMPLPMMEGKHCPNCGAKQPTYAQMSTPRSTGEKCPNCGAEDQTGNFCTECGTQLKGV